MLQSDLHLEKSGGGKLQPEGVGSMLYDYDADAVCSETTKPEKGRFC